MAGSGNTVSPWENIFNPLSQTVLNARADASGTSSVGRSAEMRQEALIRELMLRKKYALKPITGAVNPPVYTPPISGSQLPQYNYHPSTQRGYNPALAFGQALGGST